MEELKRTIVTLEGVGSFGLTRQDCEKTIRHLAIGSACIIMVKNGEKHIFDGAESHVIGEGEVLVICRGVSLDITNIKKGDAAYEARWIDVSPDIVKECGQGREKSGGREYYYAKYLPAGFAEAFERAAESFGGMVPADIAKLRVKELIMWLESAGYFSYFKSAGGLKETIRRKVMTDIAGGWTCAELAKEAGMSESTLRRKLAKESVTIAGLITDVRMSCALNMLQCTDLSITEIAYETGYESPSRFAARFRTRFGFPPSLIRGHDRV